MQLKGATLTYNLSHSMMQKGSLALRLPRQQEIKKTPAQWWDSYGDECLELQRFAIRVLSLTCTLSRCERNWSVFEMMSFYILNVEVFGKNLINLNCLFRFIQNNEIVCTREKWMTWYL